MGSADPISELASRSPPPSDRGRPRPEWPGDIGRGVFADVLGGEAEARPRYLESVADRHRLGAEERQEQRAKWSHRLVVTVLMSAITIAASTTLAVIVVLGWVVWSVLAGNVDVPTGAVVPGAITALLTTTLGTWIRRRVAHRGADR